MSNNHFSAPRGFDLMPPVVKNLLIINGLFFLGTMAMGIGLHIDLYTWLGLHPIESQHFRPIQFVTHMFMHFDERHILSNLFMLWMFGAALESYWGGKRFLIYYMVTGLGSAFLHLGVHEIHIFITAAKLSPEVTSMIQEQGYALLLESKNYADPLMASYNQLINTNMVGASGAVFGVLLAFGMMFPNTVMFPIPIQAKYLVILYGLFEMYSIMRKAPDDNVAHFAHLGGMAFGYFLIQYWKKHPTRFS